MAEAVLDSSAVLAVLNEEPGADRVEAVMDRALLSAVNLTEVVTKLVEKGASDKEAELIIGALGCRVVNLDAATAFRAGLLRRQTEARGLSLGDRACLALALAENLPALTTDRIWKEVDVGVFVETVR